jgi:hypothetical protein
MMKYYPYKSDKPGKKYYIITNDNKKVYFGSSNYSDFTIHKDEARRQRYVARHEKNESKFWNDPNTASYWALKYLWSYPSKQEAYKQIETDLKKRRYIN